MTNLAKRPQLTPLNMHRETRKTLLVSNSHTHTSRISVTHTLFLSVYSNAASDVLMMTLTIVKQSKLISEIVTMHQPILRWAWELWHVCLVACAFLHGVLTEQ